MNDEPDTYFANALVRVDRAHGEWRAIVLCGCGCGGEGEITSFAVSHIASRYGDELRGALLTLDGHGPGLHTGRGALWLAPAPPVVLYVDHAAMGALGVVAAANEALRGLAMGGVRA